MTEIADPFINHPSHHNRVLTDSTAARVVPAVLTSANSPDRPGVAVLGATGPRLVVTPDAAFRIAGEIADVIESLRNEIPTEKENAR